MQEYNLDFKKITEGEAELVTMLSDEKLEHIGNLVVDGIDNDLNSRSGGEKDVDEWLKLAAQIREDKSFPWPDSANVKYPILTIAATQFAARAYSALLSGPDYVQGRVIGPDASGNKMAKAIKIGKHMSYQLKEEMTSWESDTDRLLHTLPITGTAFKKTYFDSAKGAPVSEYVSPKDLIVNYHAKSLEQAYSKSHILELTSNELQSMIISGIYKDWGEEMEVNITPLMTNADDSQNITPGVADAASTYRLYECHTWLDLDGDGYEEPYIITVDSTVT